jgi:hypothetical protein
MPPAPVVSVRILARWARGLLAGVAGAAVAVAALVAWPALGAVPPFAAPRPVISAPQPVIAAAEPIPRALEPAGERFLCDGEPLLVERLNGAVDALGIPNTLAGTLPGAYVVLRWQGVQLQLPRTNNAGAPSYSDGKWAWREPEPDQAELLLRSPGGDLRRYRCQAQAARPGGASLSPAAHPPG